VRGLARQLGGVIEVSMDPGRPDVATETTVFEVKPRSDLERGAQQAVAFSGRCGLAAGACGTGADVAA